MKKPIIVSMIMAFMLLAWSSFASAQPQESTKEEKPTFYRLIPGVYVNGWPRFTVTYPKDWVERHTNPLRGGVFRVSSPGPVDIPTLVVILGVNPLPLVKFADFLAMVFRSSATDVTVVSDKPSRPRDGFQAREVEITKVENSVPRSTLALATKKDDLWVITMVESLKGKIGEDLRAILSSLEFQPGKDEPVKVPPDVQKLLDRHCSASVAHDITQLMATYSDKYLNSGERKGKVERFYRQTISSTTSCEIGITDFVPASDRAYLTGFLIINGKKWPLAGVATSIIKENSEWKWHGNQRNPSPSRRSDNNYDIAAFYR
jgi:hypothetical protein